MTVKAFINQINNRSIDDFLGLSPGQMDCILYDAVEEKEQILSFNDSFEPGLLENVEAVGKIKLLLNMVGEAGEAKATKNGFLPIKIVNAIGNFNEPEFYHITSEEVADEVRAVRFAATDCGWLKKKNGKFSLTKKGEQIFKNGFTPAHYVTLLKYWIFDYSWSFSDGFPEYPRLQQASLFALYILREKAQEGVPIPELALLFARAFPKICAQNSADPNTSNEPHNREFPCIFNLRFIERFAIAFGLVEATKDKPSYFGRREALEVKTTALFSAVCSWFPADKQGPFPVIVTDGNDLVH